MGKDVFEEYEDFQRLLYRMDAEGFHYCFDGYSSWEEIQDVEFHKLRVEYLNAARKLKSHIKSKKIELENKIDEELYDGDVDF